MEKHRILIVDDNPLFSTGVHLVLKFLGEYDVCEVNCSSAAFAAAREYRPDLVILDVDMPGKDGGEVAAELRNDPQLRRIPLLFLSGIVPSLDCGAREDGHYLPKPLEPQSLANTLRAILSPASA
jgi:CheY-like chemotaxis protein